jgi:uncharacterized protein YuzE
MMKRREKHQRSIFTPSILLFLLILTTFPYANGETLYEREKGVKAPIEPTVWIELEEDVLMIDVDTETNDFNYIKGSVHCDIPKAAPPGYQVNAKIYVGNSVMFEFILHRSLPVMDFQVTLTISKSNSANVPRVYNFWGNWITESPRANGPISEVFCEVWALPFGEVHFSDIGYILVKEGKWYDLEIPISNNGNCPAKITITIETENNVNIDISQATIDVPHKDVDQFKVRIKTGSGSPDQGDVKMTITSNIQGKNMKDVHTIQYEKDKRILGPFTAPWVIVFLSVFSSIILITLAVIFWQYRRSLNK